MLIFLVDYFIYLSTFLLIACYSFLILSPFSNLRRLVHAMILKRPPREWIGTFRLVIFIFSVILPHIVFNTSSVVIKLSNNIFFNSRHLQGLGLVASDTGAIIKVGLGLAMAALGGLFFIRFLRSSQS